MSKSLKNFVEKHRDAFDDKEPPKAVWKKIENALPQRKHMSLWASVGMWRAAAVLFMGLSVYLLLSSPEGESNKMASREMQGEFKAVESFYSAEIEKKVKLINDFDGLFEKDQFSQDLAKLDAMYQVLSDEMKSSPSQKVKDALILNMLVRIDLLNQQIKKLEESKEKKGGDERSS
ncbi:MAG: hypothetical protein AB7E82_15250 [Cyclobacteriaceae bacterium]